MSVVWLALGAAAAVGGLAVMLSAFRRPAIDPAAVLAELDVAQVTPLDAFEERLTQPLAPRLLRPIGARVWGGLKGLLPRNYMERLRHRLVVSGLSARIGPEEFVAIQVLALASGILVGLLLPALRGWGPVGLVRSVGVCAVLGAVMPVNWMMRARDARQEAIRRDLPDILDLLAISVEAGVGLEGAIEVVTSHFDSPLADELGRMLREMTLGVSRRTALQDLKGRIEVPEVSNFVMSLVQADALGMPLGRVLHAQAHEMRAKRRQWARERAAKLPVKILFPLLMFILPALFVVVLGPAVLSIAGDVL